MTALYNEIDEYAAQWLRNLIAAGHIAPGVVDTRSVEDLPPDYVSRFTQVHLFAGIGVWSYAARLAGISDDRPLWTLSCPCQPFSAAGKGGGFADERHLWPAAFHLIEQCRPGRLYGEQVADRGGLAWLDLVQADLEGTDYAFGAVDTCSAGFGAPHRRQRLRFTAVDNTSVEGLEGHARNGGSVVGWPSTARPVAEASAFGIGREMAIFDSRGGDASAGVRQANVGGSDGTSGRLADDIHNGHRQQRDGMGGTAGTDQSAGDQRQWVRPVAADGGTIGGVDNATITRCVGSLGNSEGIARDETRLCMPDARCEIDELAVTSLVGLDARAGSDATGSRLAKLRFSDVDLFGGMADTDGRNASAERQQRSGEHGFQPQDGRGGFDASDRPRPTNGFWRAADWLLCRDPSGPKWRPVEPCTFPLAHGATSRVGRLRAYGNAVDAQATKAFIEATL